MRIKDLNDNPSNPRKVKEGHHEMLSKSLDEFGDISGIVHNITTNRLLGGHQRKFSFKENYPIIITAEYDPPTKTGTIKEGYVDADGERYFFRQVKWDEKKEIAANIAANKGAGSFDFPMLTEHLNFLDAENYNLELTMFDAMELDQLLGGWDSDISAINDVNATDSLAPATIKITCPKAVKDEVLIFLKAKFLETSFEGVHVE